MNSFYTYMYVREDGTPYYIGKGTGKRMHSERHSVWLPPKERRVYLKTSLTEEEALKHERYMIHVLGRKDIGTGILRNLTDGGDGGSGIRHTEKTKEKMRQKKVGKNNPNWKGGITKPRPKGIWRGKPISELTPEEKEERKWELHDMRVLSQMKNR